MKHRVFALALALCMALTVLPGFAFAPERQPLPEPLQTPAALPDLTAQPGAETYSVTMTCSGPGVAQLYAASAGARESVYFLADPEPGYKVSFDKCGYFMDQYDMRLFYIGSNLYEIVMPDGNVVLDLEFVPIESDRHDVTVTVSEGGVVSVDQSAAKKGESIFVEVISGPDHVLESVKARADGEWVPGYYLGKANGAARYEVFMPDSDLEIIVTFEPICCRVSVEMELEMGGTAFLDRETAAIGETVTLTCVPDEGYRVARITGAEVTDNGDNTYSFVADAASVELRVLFLRENNPFLDVNETHFFYESVLWAAEQGITHGLDDTRFGPDEACSRAQVVTFLWRAAGSPTPESRENPFADVEDGVWYTDAVLWAVEQGITNGLDGTRFGPDETCSRAQVVTFLYRAGGSPEVKAEKNPFTDVEEGGFYRDAVLWALENGVTTGESAGIFNPNGECLRAQVVTFLHRADRIPEPFPGVE